jgi:hypothetical protein
VYAGGGSQAGWSFDLSGNLVSLMQNEGGDQSGWGSRLAFAEHDSIGNWTFSNAESNPYLLKAPRMFRHGNDLYLLGRTDSQHQYQYEELWFSGLPSWLHHLLTLALYSLRTHGTALWKVDTANHKLVKVADLPGCGQTAYTSIQRISKHKYLLANASSPLDKCNSWS